MPTYTISYEVTVSQEYEIESFSADQAREDALNQIQMDFDRELVSIEEVNLSVIPVADPAPSYTSLKSLYGTPSPAPSPAPQPTGYTRLT